VSSANCFTETIVKSMNKDPVIFAMANPNPEIIPTVAREYRPDCIVATGRSDYPNQINNVMCFPFLFRAALDCRASQINEEMKMAAAKAIAALAREEVPDAVRKAIPGREFVFGREYIVPTPFDPRLMERVACAVVQAAAKSGVAKCPITDMDAYKQSLKHALSAKL
jgi:malate dehydrogenase (oxaloacetate-decarboxylating)(NADP+)